MNKLLIVTLPLIFSVILFIISAILLNSKTLTPGECELAYNKKDGEQCGVKEDDQCYKGKVQGDKCVTEAPTVFNILLLISFLLLVTSICLAVFLR